MKPEPLKKNIIFSIAISLGIALAIGSYTFDFGNLSETELVQRSFIWLPLLAFGIYGKLFEAPGNKIEKNILDGIEFIFIQIFVRKILMVWVLGFLSWVTFLLPLKISESLKIKSPLIAAIIAVFYWMIILGLFFMLIFPAL